MKKKESYFKNNSNDIFEDEHKTIEHLSNRLALIYLVTYKSKIDQAIREQKDIIGIKTI
ncbi:hypothetical protein [Desulfosarcina widdelii]|uniref:hypothetical protein n=1 Tax=Desulfosarcina widdelii TaxID=947919 RepID=UPI0012D33DD9|nr:hypothetical protein [Desulfosarcina widdelii]